MLLAIIYLSVDVDQLAVPENAVSVTADGPRDTLCQFMSCELWHDCGNKCTADKSDGVRELRLTDVSK